MEENYSVYIIETTCGKLYTGVSTDPVRRFDEHLSGNKGAKFFRSATPKEIVYLESGLDRSSALKREIEIKKMTKKQKLTLLNLYNTTR